jgi:hypothetical protein
LTEELRIKTDENDLLKRKDKGLDKLIKDIRDISNSYVDENIMEE